MRSSETLDFSFSGLKTAFVYRLRELGSPTEAVAADLAASYQRAVVDALVTKVGQALDLTGARRLAIGGGVAANTELRARLVALAELRHLELNVPPAELCTDNAAMIASAARQLRPSGYPVYLGFDAFARAS
jgi:N6-L-threonylcarbamoyladenine synthase